MLHGGWGGTNLGNKIPREQKQYRTNSIDFLPVFSLISHKTLKSAGFILWQFKACFLERKEKRGGWAQDCHHEEQLSKFMPAGLGRAALSPQCCKQPPTHGKGDECHQFRNENCLGHQAATRPVRGRRCSTAEPAALGSQARINCLFQHRHSTRLSLSPTSNITPGHVLYLWGRGEINSSLPQCWKHPLLRAVNSGNFSAQRGAQKDTWREKPIPLPPCYLHPAYLQVLKFNSLQLGQ